MTNPTQPACPSCDAVPCECETVYCDPAPTQSLLSRYAACADKLRGTGAPEVYPWIQPFTDYSDTIDGITCQRFDSCIYNPDAALCGFVCWAMEVAGHRTKEKRVSCDVANDGLAGWWWHYFNLEEKEKLGGHSSTPAEAWCRVVEAICEGVGK